MFVRKIWILIPILFINKFEFNANPTTTTSSNEMSPTQDPREVAIKDVQGKTQKSDSRIHPYVVSVQREMVHICTGTIVNPIFVLTVAHCLTSTGYKMSILDPIMISVVGGHGQLSMNNTQIRWVKNIFVHNFFKKRTLSNDIALLGLYQPFQFNQFISLVPLASSISKPYKHFPTCHVLTWFIPKKKSLDLNTLLEKIRRKELSRFPTMERIELTTISQDECVNRINSKNFVTSDQLCTDHGTFKEVSCATDAGSPLICGGKQYGILSWGIGCDEHMYPGVFTKIAAYRKWMSDIEIDPRGYISSSTSFKCLKNFLFSPLHFVSVCAMFHETV